MIFVDSSAWFALYSLRDANHSDAAQLFQTCGELLVTTDFVIDETLTLLRARSENERATAFGQKVIDESAAQVVRVNNDDFSAAWRTFREFHDKEWSFTDCTSLVVMQRLGIERAFSFDNHFRQFGTMTVLPS